MNRDPSLRLRAVGVLLAAPPLTLLWVVPQWERTSGWVLGAFLVLCALLMVWAVAELRGDLSKTRRQRALAFQRERGSERCVSWRSSRAGALVLLGAVALLLVTTHGQRAHAFPWALPLYLVCAVAAYGALLGLFNTQRIELRESELWIESGPLPRFFGPRGAVPVSPGSSVQAQARHHGRGGSTYELQLFRPDGTMVVVGSVGALEPAEVLCAALNRALRTLTT